jgi:hypothetical protein
MSLSKWRERARHRRASRALERQRIYQRMVARWLREGRQDAPIQKATAVHELLSCVELPANARILEVGGGGRGLLFYLPYSGIGVAVDPLAVHYNVLFSGVVSRARRCAAFGEQLPFPGDTVHFTPRAVRRMLASLPLQMIVDHNDVESVRRQARRQPPSRFGDRLKRFFFKNAHHVLIARRSACTRLE